MKDKVSARASRAATGTPAPSSPQLQSLLERVEAGETAPSLSRDIQCQVGGWYRRTPSEGRTKRPTFIHPDDCRDGKPVYDSLHGTDIWHEPPDVVGSLDGALALCERVLPGWLRSLDERFLEKPFWYADVLSPEASDQAGCFEGVASTPPIALLSAMLKALIAQKDTPSTLQKGGEG